MSATEIVIPLLLIVWLEIAIPLLLIVWAVGKIYHIMARADKVLKAVTLGELLDKGIRYDPEVQNWIDNSGAVYELLDKDAKDNVLFLEKKTESEYEHYMALHSLTDDKHGS